MLYKYTVRIKYLQFVTLIFINAEYADTSSILNAVFEHPVIFNDDIELFLIDTFRRRLQFTILRVTIELLNTI